MEEEARAIRSHAGMDIAKIAELRSQPSLEILLARLHEMGTGGGGVVT
jgi:hypothetical protein